MAALEELYDVVVVGATPAGGAAAIAARRAGLTCVLIEPDAWPRAQTHLDWLGPVGIAFLRTCGLQASTVGAEEFRGLRLYSWDFKRSARVDEAGLSGWIVDRATFDQALLQVAQSEGAELLVDAEPQRLNLGEDRVSLGLPGGREVSGRILLIADGLRSHVAGLARMSTAEQSESVSLCAEVIFDVRSAQAGLDVVIGARRLPQSVTIVRAGRQTRVTLVSRDQSAPVESQLEEFVSAAQAAQLLPEELPAPPPPGLSPAGVALEMETLVGKRCLLIGETGGFVAAFSNESVYPAMKSGWVASEAAGRALAAPVLQDELLSFSPAWRAELADYLRLPNTDLALLMPLVFSNPQMSARVARAFLLGQSF